MTKTEIKFGPGGFGMPAEEAFPKLEKDDLSAAEIEFTYGVNLTNEESKRLGELAKKHYIQLSIHAPYYINLNAEERQKIFMSKKRILDSCERAHHMGAKYVVFHPAFYFKDSKVKLEFALGKGKKLHDKRESEKERDVARKLQKGKYDE